MKLCRECSNAVYRDEADFCVRHQLHYNWKQNLDVDNMGFWSFCKNVIPKAFKSFKYGEPHFHKEIAWEVLQDKPNWKFYDRQIVIAVFRGSSKTTIVSKAIPLYCALLGLKKYIVIASKTQRSAEKNLRWIKAMLGTSKIIEIFGDLRPERYNTKQVDTIQGKWTTNFILLNNGVVIEAVGMGQHLRGSAEGEEVERIDLFLADDTESDENTKTAERREDNKVWLFETVLPSLDVDTGTICFINTETDTDSILSTLLKPESNWRKVEYPISINRDGVEIPTWAEKFDLGTIEKIKNNYTLSGRLSSFYKEYYNIIRSERGFDDKLIRYWYGRLFTKFGLNWLELHTSINPNMTIIPVNTYLGIDGAYSMNRKADYTALVPIAIDSVGNIYILPYKRGRMSVFDRSTIDGSTTGFVDEAYRLHELYNFNAVIFGVEGQQLGYFTQLKDKLIGLTRVIPHENKGDKTDMLYDFLAPKYEVGKIYHTTGMSDLWRELVSFGNTTDDILDAEQMAIRYAKTPQPAEYNPIWGAMEPGTGIDDGSTRKTDINRNWYTN